MNDTVAESAERIAHTISRLRRSRLPANVKKLTETLLSQVGQELNNECDTCLDFLSVCFSRRDPFAADLLSSVTAHAIRARTGVSLLFFPVILKTSSLRAQMHVTNSDIVPLRPDTTSGPIPEFLTFNGIPPTLVRTPPALIRTTALVPLESSSIALHVHELIALAIDQLRCPNPILCILRSTLQLNEELIPDTSRRSPAQTYEFVWPAVVSHEDDPTSPENMAVGRFLDFRTLIAPNGPKDQGKMAQLITGVQSHLRNNIAFPMLEPGELELFTFGRPFHAWRILPFIAGYGSAFLHKLPSGSQIENRSDAPRQALGLN